MGKGFVLGKPRCTCKAFATAVEPEPVSSVRDCGPRPAFRATFTEIGSVVASPPGRMVAVTPALAKLTETAFPRFCPEITASNCEPWVAVFGVIELMTGRGATNPASTRSLVPPPGEGLTTLTPLESVDRNAGGTNATRRCEPRYKVTSFVEPIWTTEFERNTPPRTS